MRFAVISDIHNNFEAFNTTLDDINSREVDKICCLGDLVGYGPDPIKCIDLMLKLRDKGRLEICLPGNHDQAVMFDPEGFNPLALAAVQWTRRKIDESGARSSERWDFLSVMQNPQAQYYYKDELLFVHGSPRNFLNEYVFDVDHEELSKMRDCFACFDNIPSKTPLRYCFMGHTHVPGVFVDEKVHGKYLYYSPSDIETEFDGKLPLGSSKLMINVGSVGQPRDGNPDSCYVILNYEKDGSDNYVEYHRVKYDVSKTVASFEKNIFQKVPKEFEELSNSFQNPKFLMNRIKIGK